jgi:hypothetical protein
MTEPTVVPAKANVKRPRLRKELTVWRKKLANPELLERAVFFNQADYFDIRIPRGRRLWLSSKLRIDFSKWQNWERETESYLIAIPVGGQRKVGMEPCFAEPLLSDALDELRKRPQDFPNLRHSSSRFGSGEDIWWGEDISDLWAQPRTLEIHRAIDRAFGYRENVILKTYPDKWVDR